MVRIVMAQFRTSFMVLLLCVPDSDHVRFAFVYEHVVSAHLTRAVWPGSGGKWWCCIILCSAIIRSSSWAGVVSKICFMLISNALIGPIYF